MLVYNPYLNVQPTSVNISIKPVHPIRKAVAMLIFDM